MILLDHSAVEQICQWLKVHTVGFIVSQQRLPRLLISAMPPSIPESAGVGATLSLQFGRAREAHLRLNAFQTARMCPCSMQARSL